ncbi:hypothetical protein ACHAQA_002828 [Verticillium albo-atrum]
MLFFRHIQTLSFIASQAVTASVIHQVRTVPHLHGIDAFGQGDALAPRGSELPTGAILLARFDPTNDGLPTIISRRGNNGKECPACLDRCPRGQIKDREDCNRCQRCPAGQGPNLNYEICVPDNAADRAKDEDNNDSNKKGRPSTEEKLQAFDRKLEAMKVVWKDGDAARKKVEQERERKWEEQRVRDERGAAEQRSKARRAGRCLVIVPLAMSAEAMAEYGDNAFDEEFLETQVKDLAELVPEGTDVGILEGEDGDSWWESDEYLSQWASWAADKFDWGEITKTCGNAPCYHYPRSQDVQNERRDESTVEAREISVRAPDTTALIVPLAEETQVRKRWFFALILPALIRTGSALAGAAARAGGAAVRAFRAAPKGQARFDAKGMREAAKQIAKDENWTECLNGRGPKK